MTGLVHLVTGSTGIGAATAARLMTAGDDVLVASRTEEHGRALVARLATGPGRIAHAAEDLTSEDGADRAVAACVERFGRVDGLLSVAGGSGRGFGDGLVHELSVDGWDRTIELNLRSQALVARAVVRQLLRQEPTEDSTAGAIVLVSSVLAAHPEPRRFGTHAYAAAKGAIVSLGVGMAAAYADRGIRVNVLAPGLTATPMAARAASDRDLVAYAGRKQPLAGGLLDPDDIASVAAFLLRPESRMVTGQVLAVDGGWSVVSASPEPAA